MIFRYFYFYFVLFILIIVTSLQSLLLGEEVRSLSAIRIIFHFYLFFILFVRSISLKNERSPQPFLPSFLNGSSRKLSELHYFLSIARPERFSVDIRIRYMHGEGKGKIHLGFAKFVDIRIDQP